MGLFVFHCHHLLKIAHTSTSCLASAVRNPTCSVCEVSYANKYMMNTVFMPVLLLGFVYGAWACNGTDVGIVEGTDSATKAFNDEVRARAKASMRGAHSCSFWVHIYCCCLRWAVNVAQATTTSRYFCAVSNFLAFNSSPHQLVLRFVE